MSKSLTTKEFIEKAIVVHGGDKFSYEFVEYKNYQTKVTIVCKKHNQAFQQTPNNHLSGQGCPLCKGESTSNRCRSNTAKFIEEAKLVHAGDKYDYSLVKYGNGNKDDVKIICDRHGVFLQSPHSHLRGCGCPSCSMSDFAETRRFDNSVFIEKSQQVHGKDRYQYNLVDYVAYHTPVKILCKEHGVFEQQPANHLRGTGCPYCANYGFDLTENAVLYVHEIVGISHSFTGYGITRNEVVRRKKHLRELNRNGYTMGKSFVTEEMTGKFIHMLEQNIISEFQTDVETSHIKGFKRESTTAPFHEVVAFVQNYIEQNKEPHGDT